MPVLELNPMLLDSAVEVLETMFFTTVADDDQPDPSTAPWISAILAFHGKPSGRFGIRLPVETGRKIAASFLGAEEEELTEPEIGEVVCELANMLCGSLVSHLEKDTLFNLSHPELNTPEGVHPPGSTSRRLLRMDEGSIEIWLELAQAQAL